MECLWRRTLASIFLLLSPHSFLCQNVVPSRPLPLMNESLKECAAMNSGPASQQISLISSNGGFPEFTLRRQCPVENKRISEQIGPSQKFTVPQASNGPCPQRVSFGTSQIDNVPKIQSSVCNTVPNTNIPPAQASRLNIVSAPLVVNKQYNTSPNTNLTPLKEISPFCLLSQGPSSQCTKDDTPPVPNVRVSQGFPKPIISSIPMVLNIQNEIATCSQRPQENTTGLALNTAPVIGFPNHNTLTLPMSFNPYTQSSIRPSTSVPCQLMSDLTSLNSLPTPNVPVSYTKNCAPISQAPVQPVSYFTSPFPTKSIVPVDCMLNAAPNYQISALPPVFPENIPQINNNFCRNPVPATEEYVPVPINLHINMPPPTIPEPKITVITAYPPAPPAPPVTVSSDSSGAPLELFPPFPLPPIIIESKKSKAKSLLPLILIALIANDGCSCGGCGCPCDCASSNIPIPYPIPIPTNNPIIIGNKRRLKNSTKEKKASHKKKD